MNNRGLVSGQRLQWPSGLRKLLPAYLAPAPSSSSIRNSWLYFASRSLRHGAPVLICTTLHSQYLPIFKHKYYYLYMVVQNKSASMPHCWSVRLRRMDSGQTDASWRVIPLLEKCISPCYDLDLWHSKRFQKCVLIWQIFVPSFIKIYPLSK